MKHIFIGLDGTWEAAFRDRKPEVLRIDYGQGRRVRPLGTNVFQFNMALDRQDINGRQQLHIYTPGVGTSAGTKIIGGALGAGLDEIVLSAYTNLVTNYERGDQVYILGFSRGAVAARALAGFVSTVGLEITKYHRIGDLWKQFVGSEQHLGTKSGGSFSDLIAFLDCGTRY